MWQALEYYLIIKIKYGNNFCAAEIKTNSENSNFHGISEIHCQRKTELTEDGNFHLFSANSKRKLFETLLNYTVNFNDMENLLLCSSVLWVLVWRYGP
jgi:hypothetical protein